MWRWAASRGKSWIASRQADERNVRSMKTAALAASPISCWTTNRTGTATMTAAATVDSMAAVDG